MRYGKQLSWLPLLAVLIGSSQLGCSRFPRGFSWSKSKHVTPVRSLVDYEPAGAPAEGNEESLSAIDEFLARTNSYARNKSTVDNEAPTSDRKPETLTSQTVDGATTGATPNDITPSTVAAASPVERSLAVTNTGVEIVVPQDPVGPALPVVESVTIRTTNNPVPKTDEPEPSRTTNQALAMAAPDERLTVEELLQRLEKDARANGGFERWWRLQLGRLSLGRTALDMDGATNLPGEDSRILKAVATTLQAIHPIVIDGSLAGHEAWASAQQLTSLLAERADPVVPTLALCRRVVTYGVYDELPPEELIAGRATQAIVYTEVGNLKSERIEQSRVRTILGTRLELLTASGESVWQHEEPEIIDVCRRRRSDFFIAQRVTLPANLAAGDYVLKVLVDDKLSGKAHESTLPLVFLAPASLATRG